MREKGRDGESEVKGKGPEKGKRVKGSEGYERKIKGNKDGN